MRARLLWKLELTYVFVLAAVLVGVDFYAGRVLRQQAFDETFLRLSSLHTLAAQTFPADGSSLPAWAARTARSGERVTVVSRDGEVLADSSEDPKAMENHGGRPEILEAWRSGEGRAVRYSNTVHRDMLYLARRVSAPGGEEVALRLSAPLAVIDSAQAQIRMKLWLVSAVALLLGALFSFYSSRGLSRRVDGLREFAARVATGNFAPLPAEREGDELSALARSLNSTAAQLDAAMRALREERDRAETILRSMVEAVAVVDPGERLRFFNRAFGEMAGIRPEASEGRPLVEVVRQPEILRLIRRALSERHVVTDEVEITRGEDLARESSYSATVSPVPTEGGDGAVLVLHDITELRRLERVRRDFVANVSHEFRTPLTAVQGFAETLLSGALHDAGHNRRFLEIIRDHAVRMGRLTADLLRLSQIEARKLELELRPVNVCSVLSACAETAHFEAAQKQLAVTVNCPPSLPPAQADSTMLREAVQNLVDNAVRYTPDGGRVRLEGALRDGRVVISVHDTGIGIPRHEQQRIFERFYRVDPGRSRELGGTGLGLSITKHLVEAQHGRIEVESEVGRGSTFQILLPVASGGEPS